MRIVLGAVMPRSSNEEDSVTLQISSVTVAFEGLQLAQQANCTAGLPEVEPVQELLSIQRGRLKNALQYLHSWHTACAVLMDGYTVGNHLP